MDGLGFIRVVLLMSFVRMDFVFEETLIFKICDHRKKKKKVSSEQRYTSPMLHDVPSQESFTGV